MDIQATIKSPSPQASSSGSTVKSTSSAGTASNDNSFAAFLQGLPQAETNETNEASSDGAVDDKTASIIGSLQLMQTLLAPLTDNQPIQLGDSGSLENTLSSIPGLPLQNPPVQLLLQDPKLRTVSDLQNVNPTLLPDLVELKKAIEPKTVSTPQSSGELDALPVQNIIVLSGQEDRLQQTKFRLDMLAARNTGVAVSLQEQLFGGKSTDNSEPHSSNGDSSQLPNMQLPLLDLLKSIGQAEPLPAAIPQGMVNAQSFVREMSQFVTNNMKFSLGDVMKEARLSLHPEQLGHVDVKITLHEGGQLVAQFAADTTAGRQLLESQLPQLRQALQSQGLQVERLEVAQEQAGAAGMFQQSRQQSSGGQSFERQPRQRITKLEANEGEFASGLHMIAEQIKELEQPAETSFDATA